MDVKSDLVVIKKKIVDNQKDIAITMTDRQLIVITRSKIQDMVILNEMM